MRWVVWMAGKKVEKKAAKWVDSKAVTLVVELEEPMAALKVGM